MFKKRNKRKTLWWSSEKNFMEDPGQRQGTLLKYCGEAVGILWKTQVRDREYCWNTVVKQWKEFYGRPRSETGKIVEILWWSSERNFIEDQGQKQGKLLKYCGEAVKGIL